MSLAMHPLAGSRSCAVTAADTAIPRCESVESHPRGKERGEGVHAPRGRHALLAAVTAAIDGIGAPTAGAASSAPPGESSVGDRESRHALHAFVHELFAALRPSESEGRHGRGFAWGRTSPSDLVQRLDALVQRLRASAPASPPAGPTSVPEAPAPESTPTDATPPSDAPPAPPSAGTPATDATAAPPPRVPVDPLLSAFQRLLAVRHPADGGAAVSPAGSDALVAFLQRMAQVLGGEAASGSPVPGTLLDVTA